MNWYHWLVNNGLWKDVLSFAVIAGLTAAAGLLPWRRQAARQRHIEDLLNTETPGGLTEVVKALHPAQVHIVSQTQAHDHKGNPS